MLEPSTRVTNRSFALPTPVFANTIHLPSGDERAVPRFDPSSNLVSVWVSLPPAWVALGQYVILTVMSASLPSCFAMIFPRAWR
jgi:hypothetical protein